MSRHPAINRFTGLPGEPHVAVCVDKSRSFGRGVLLGVSDYLESINPWSIYVANSPAELLQSNWHRRWKGNGILTYVPDERSAARLLKAGIPVVDVAGYIKVDGLPSVTGNEEAIGALAADHLLDRQFRHFAFVGPGADLVDHDRYAGFAARIKQRDAKLTCIRFKNPRAPKSLSEWERCQERLAEWIQALPKPVGVMAYSDPQGLRVLEACLRIKTAVPETVAVVGVDNDEELCRLARVPLSSVVNNPRRIGFEAARMIDQLMTLDNMPARIPHVIIDPLYVITRRSTEYTAVDDPAIVRALTYIRQHASEPIDVHDVARAVDLPRRSLYRRFAHSLDRTPHDELQQERLYRAKTLLAESDFKLHEVARLSGFQSASYLSTAFKKAFGIPPGEYRRQTRNEWAG